MLFPKMTSGMMGCLNSSTYMHCPSLWRDQDDVNRALVKRRPVYAHFHIGPSDCWDIGLGNVDRIVSLRLLSTR